MWLWFHIVYYFVSRYRDFIHVFELSHIPISTWKKRIQDLNKNWVLENAGSSKKWSFWPQKENLPWFGPLQKPDFRLTLWFKMDLKVVVLGLHRITLPTSCRHEYIIVILTYRYLNISNGIPVIVLETSEVTGEGWGRKGSTCPGSHLYMDAKRF